MGDYRPYMTIHDNDLNEKFANIVPPPSKGARVVPARKEVRLSFDFFISDYTRRASFWACVIPFFGENINIGQT